MEPSPTFVEMDDLEFERQRQAFWNGPITTPRSKRMDRGDPRDLEGFRGPWAGVEQEGEPGPIYSATEQEIGKYEEHRAQQYEWKSGRDMTPGNECSIFHGVVGKTMPDETYLQVPSRPPPSNLIEPPKKCRHVWTGHAKGIMAMELFPDHGHLLLTGSMDTRVKLWDVYRDKRLLRTFVGHTKAVKSLEFLSDGHKFLSASYDKSIRLWDTETGQCIQWFQSKGFCYCVELDPQNDDVFLVGASDRQVCQWDVRSGKIVREYKQHTDSVNAVAFVDDSHFVSGSDDKTVCLWSVGATIPIQSVASTSPVTWLSIHPTDRIILVQTQSNQIQTLAMTEARLRVYWKQFAGHTTAGHACRLDSSPDGRYIVSGDSRGELWFWNWNTAKPARVLKCHDKVVTNCLWHPTDPTKIVTCSWDATAKCWE